MEEEQSIMSNPQPYMIEIFNPEGEISLSHMNTVLKIDYYNITFQDVFFKHESRYANHNFVDSKVHIRNTLNMSYNFREEICQEFVKRKVNQKFLAYTCTEFLKSDPLILAVRIDLPF